MTREEIHQKVVEILADSFELEADTIKPESTLYEELDLDSIDAVDIFVQMRDITGRRPDPEKAKLIRTVEEDPRDLTGARKYLSVYLLGARDATIKFADIYANTRDSQARDDYLALLDDLDKNFAARTHKSLLEDKTDLNIEIEVLRERLSREGVRLD